jgi:hypothetical protein
MCVLTSSVLASTQYSQVMYVCVNTESGYEQTVYTFNWRTHRHTFCIDDIDDNFQQRISDQHMFSATHEQLHEEWLSCKCVAVCWTFSMKEWGKKENAFKQHKVVHMLVLQEFLPASMLCIWESETLHNEWMYHILQIQHLEPGGMGRKLAFCS